MPTKPESLKHLTKKQVLARLLKIAKGIKEPAQLACIDEQHQEVAGCILQRLTGQSFLMADDFFKFGINNLSPACLEEIMDANDSYYGGAIKKSEMIKAIKMAVNSDKPEEADA